MIIGITGEINSGKDTAGEILKELINEPRVSIKKFAGLVKIIAGKILNVPVEKFEDREFKASETFLGITVRELLQKIGTEAFREGIDQDFWIKCLLKDYKSYNFPGKSPIHETYWHKECPKCRKDYFGWKRQPYCNECSENLWPIWIITDVRFPNEAQAIKEKGGIIIKITRPTDEKVEKTHPSESSVSLIKADYDLSNDGNLVDLKILLTTLYGLFIHPLLKLE